MTKEPTEPIAFDWERGEDFLDCFQDAALATLRTKRPSSFSMSAGDLCALLLRFKDRDTDFQLHATILEADGGEVLFQFLAEERMRLEMVLVSARGESLPYRRRRQTRIPLHCQATLTLSGQSPKLGRTFNLGAGGLQLHLENPIALEETVAVLISLPDRVTLDLVGRISGKIDEGPEQGNSVEFLFRSPSERDSVAEQVERILAESKK